MEESNNEEYVIKRDENGFSYTRKDIQETYTKEEKRSEINEDNNINEQLYYNQLYSPRYHNTTNYGNRMSGESLKNGIISIVGVTFPCLIFLLCYKFFITSWINGSRFSYWLFIMFYCVIWGIVVRCGILGITKGVNARRYNIQRGEKDGIGTAGMITGIIGVSLNVCIHLPIICYLIFIVDIINWIGLI